MLQLRGYQEDALNKLRASFANGHRAVMFYLPTGGGKTECAISLLDLADKKGNKSAMVMDRRILCDQTSKRLGKYNIDHGVLMAGHWRYRPEKPIQICSVQTLEKREGFPPIKLLVIDEAHSNRASIIEFVKNYPEIKVVGLSASPFTKGLGNTYTDVVSGSTTKELVNMGMLSPLRVFIAKEVDMTGAKKIAGEWSDKEASERGIKIVGDVVSEWVKKTHEIFNRPVKTIVFSSGVAHGEALSKQFAEAGYNFISISYKDDDEYKEEVLKDFAKEDSSIHGIIATDILTKGFDQADVLIGISARPFSKSFSSHVQQLGRVMRPHHSKESAIWLDHSGNFLRFYERWEDLYNNGVKTLDDKDITAKEPSLNDKEAAKCPRCGALWPPKADTCSHCGMVRVKKNEVQSISGEMVELYGQKPKKYSSEYKEKFYHGLIGYLQYEGKNINRAYHLYKEKFKEEPTWKKKAGEFNNDVINYVKKSNIAFAKSRK
jgi:superfamily II DNA or RNA helicase